MSKKKASSPATPVVGVDIPPPPLWKLLLTAVLVLVPTLWIGLTIFDTSNPQSDVVRHMMRASNAIIDYTQKQGAWPTQLEDAVAEADRTYEGVELVYSADSQNLSLKLRQPLYLPSVLYRLTFGLFGGRQEWTSVDVDLKQRMSMMGIPLPPAPKDTATD
jgi:hypothetical protein